MLHLEVEYDYDFQLLGISCHERDYRLAWHMNNELNFELEQKEPLVISQKNGESKHTLFSFVDSEEQIGFDLIANRGDGGLLLPELPQVDYLLKWEEHYELDDAQLIAQIRKIPIVLTAFNVPMERIKSKENLLY